LPTPSPAVRNNSLAKASPARAATAMSAALAPRRSAVWAPSDRATSSRRASPVPEATPSRQPRAPQPHSGPSGQTTTWADVAAIAGESMQQAAVQDDPAANPGRDDHPEHVVRPAAGAFPA